jgi:hypothetical protein
MNLDEKLKFSAEEKFSWERRRETKARIEACQQSSGLRIFEPSNCNKLVHLELKRVLNTVALVGENEQDT